MTILATIFLLTCFVIGFIIFMKLTEYDPMKYKKLKELEDQRTILENKRKILEEEIQKETQQADWVSSFLFKRYIKNGGN